MGLLKNLRNSISTPKQREQERAERQALEDELVHARRDREHKAQQLKDEREKAKRLDRERIHKEAEKIRLAEERRTKDRRIEEARLSKLRQASPETLRSLRELIRKRYELDVQIWARRGARRPDRWIVEEKMDKADAVMQEIMDMVGLWGDNSDKSWTAEEWEKVQAIRNGLKHGGHREWAAGPPWA